MAAVADNKKINLHKAEVRIEHRIHEGKPWRTDFSIQIDLGSGLSLRERKILFNSARFCEVGKLLTGEFTFDYRLMSGVDEHDPIKP